MEPKTFANAFVTGKFAGLTTAVTAAACGACRNRDALSPINAVSHIVWGDEAFARREPSLKYTYTGLALNSGACISWALVLELLFGRFARRSTASALASGAAVSALAYVTDFHVVPARLTPGFEKHLSRQSLLVVYIILALSLAAGTAAQREASASP